MYVAEELRQGIHEGAGDLQWGYARFDAVVGSVGDQVVAMSDSGSRIDVWSDISDQFEFIEENLVYVDAPLEGFLRGKTGDLFAFRCTAIVAGCLWHWVLLPVCAVTSVKAVFDTARTNPPKRWISIVEDHRDEPRLSAAYLTGEVHEIPKNVFG